MLCETLNTDLYVGKLNRWTYPLPLILGALRRTPIAEADVANKGPPTIMDAILTAYPTDTPTILLGRGINNDSTVIDKAIQKNSILKSGMLKLVAI